MGRPVENIVGNKYGYLTVIDRVNNARSGHSRWLYKCICGNMVEVLKNNLKNGNVKSCGCMHGKLSSDSHKSHGYSYSRLYRIYYSMRARCYNPNHRAYEEYGGRGITICDECMGDNGFIAFRDWAESNGYNDNLSIDRKDNNKGYFPGNCKWSTDKEQLNNRRDNHLITYKGKTHTASEWGDITGVGRDNIYCRLQKGWSIERTLTTPVNKRKKSSTHTTDSKELTVIEL